MELVKRAAYFALCPECGIHGRIICADGTESEDFFTVVIGLQEMTDLVLAEKISADEMPETKRQIEESGLVRQNRRMEVVAERIIEAEGDLSDLIERFHGELRPPIIQAAHDARVRAPTKGHSKKVLN